MKKKKKKTHEKKAANNFFLFFFLNYEKKDFEIAHQGSKLKMMKEKNRKTKEYNLVPIYKEK